MYVTIIFFVAFTRLILSQQLELTDLKARRLLQAPPTRRIVQSTGNENKYEEIDGVISLPSSKPRSSDVEEYREIAGGQIRSDASESSSEETESGGEDSDIVAVDARQATLKELEVRLNLEPTSISTWLSLLSNSLSVIPLNSKNAPKARADITLSILSRAISTHSANKKSTLLRLKILAVGEDIWSTEKLLQEWEDALSLGSVELWMAWLDWRIRTPHIGIDGIVSGGQRVLSSLGGDEVSKLRVLWRVAIAFREAGQHTSRRNRIRTNQLQASLNALWRCSRPNVNCKQCDNISRL